MAQQNHTALKLERRKEVEDRTGLSRSAIYDKISKGEFPPPIQLSARTVAWLSSEIDRWIKARNALAVRRTRGCANDPETATPGVRGRA